MTDYSKEKKTRAGNWHKCHNSIRFRFTSWQFNSILPWLFWISGTMHGKFSQEKQIS